MFENVILLSSGRTSTASPIRDAYGLLGVFPAQLALNVLESLADSVPRRRWWTETAAAPAVRRASSGAATWRLHENPCWRSWVPFNLALDLLRGRRTQQTSHSRCALLTARWNPCLLSAQRYFGCLVVGTIRAMHLQDSSCTD